MNGVSNLADTIYQWLMQAKGGLIDDTRLTQDLDSIMVGIDDINMLTNAVNEATARAGDLNGYQQNVLNIIQNRVSVQQGQQQEPMQMMQSQTGTEQPINSGEINEQF